MADDLDLGQLSATQQEALQQYTQVTDQELKDALPLLRRSEWNVQIAISRFFDGEGPDLLAEPATGPSTPLTSASRREVLQESLWSSGSRRRRPPTSDPAPRVVPPPFVLWSIPFIICSVLSPLTLGFQLVATLWHYTAYICLFLTRPLRPYTPTTGPPMLDLMKSRRRQTLSPKETAARFRREFDEAYGPNDLPFFNGSVAEAHDLAVHDTKFLLVVLLAPEHDDTDLFMRETLLAPEVVAFIRDPGNKMILWGGSVLDSEAYQVFEEYCGTKFPFSALVCLTRADRGPIGMCIVKRLTGPTSPAAYLDDLQESIGRHRHELDAVQAQRAVQNQTRTILSEQDSAYERSLARDRERTRLQREALQRSRAEALEASRLQKCRQEWRRWRSRTIAEEPPSGAPDVVRIALKIPDSTGHSRVVRRFAASTTMDELYAFVDCYDLAADADQDAESSDGSAAQPQNYNHRFGFRILSVLPRAVHEPSTTVTLGETIGRSGNFVVEGNDEQG